MLFQSIKILHEMGFEILGLAPSKTGKSILIGTKRATWDHGDKEARIFVGANIRDIEEEFISYKFSVTRTALASRIVGKLTGDAEQFLLRSGLFRFRLMLLKDDTPGGRDEFMIVSRSPEADYILDNSDFIARDVARAKQAVLKKLWVDKYSGTAATSREHLEIAACTLFSTSKKILETIEELGLMKKETENGYILTAQGDLEYENIKSNVIIIDEDTVETKPELANEYDVFISHASEDKQTFVDALAVELRESGLSVWYDDFSLKLGSSLRQSIDKGLASSRFGIVILSHAFFIKDWPQRELNGMFVKMSTEHGRILPIWHEISSEEVKQYSPMIADLLAISSDKGLASVIDAILDAINPGK